MRRCCAICAIGGFRWRCITSNVTTGAVESLDAHPVRRLFDAGVPIMLNTNQLNFRSDPIQPRAQSIIKCIMKESYKRSTARSALPPPEFHVR
jgi:hypothetical protein